MESRLADVFEIVRAIPRGKVATYGQIADLAGIPSGHRFVARAMRECPAGHPWHRVLGKHDARRARIAILEPSHWALQRKRLEREGVRFDERDLVSLADHGWRPD